MNTGKEALQYQGVPVFAAELDLPYPCHMSNLDSMTNAQQRHLAGNAINCCLAAAITAWTIGSLRLYEDELVVHRMPPAIIVIDDSDDDGNDASGTD